MPSTLTPSEDHYLKNWLVENQLRSEFQSSWADHTEFLSHLGYPFAPSSSLLATDNNHYPLLKFVFLNFIKAFPYFKDIDDKVTITSPKIEALKGDHTNNNAYFAYRIMPFFNYVLGKNLSGSADRDELTKRRKMSLKSLKLLSLFMTSCLTTQLEDHYFTTGNTGLDKKIGLSKELESQISQMTEFVDDVDDELLDRLEKKVSFCNNYAIEIIGVRTANVTTAGAGLFGFSKAASTTTSTYEFIISVKYRMNFAEKDSEKDSEKDTDHENEHSITQEFLVFRKYHDFKNLSAHIHKLFPNLNLPKLPPKYKHPALYDPNTKNSNSVPDIDDVLQDNEFTESSEEVLDFILTKNSTPKPTSKFMSPNLVKSPAALKQSLKKLNVKSPNPSEKTPDLSHLGVSENVRSLPREMLRILLNHYLLALIKFPQVAGSIHMKEFLFKESKQWSFLNEQDREDIELRKHLGHLNVRNQLVFQKKIFLQNLRFQNELTVFKNVVINSDNQRYLTANFSEDTIHKYKAYIGHNVSVVKLISNEFKNCVHISQMSPILQTVIKWFKLRFASFLYDLFFGAPTANNETISYELFSQIKSLHRFFPYILLSQIVKITNPMDIATKLLDFFLYQPPALSHLWSNSDKTKHRSLIQVLFHTVVSADIKELNNKITTSKHKIQLTDSEIIFNNMEKFVLLSEQEKISLLESKDAVLVCLDGPLDKVSDSSRKQVKESFEEESELYKNLRNILQLLTRRNDKKVIDELWNEPYLNTFIKDFLVVFFHPLVKIFSKNSSFKKCVKVFQDFMNDMISIVEHLFDYVYLLSPNEIILSLYLMISKYQDFVLEFLHESYLNDTENFFDSLADWGGKLLHLMKFFKGDDNLTKFDMGSIIKSGDIDVVKLKAELKVITDAKAKAVEKFQSETTLKPKKEDIIQENWRVIDDMKFFDASDLGLIDKNDLNEFTSDLDQLEELGGDEADSSEQFFDAEESTLSENFKEIKKLEGPFKSRLVEILSVYQDQAEL